MATERLGPTRQLVPSVSSAGGGGAPCHAGCATSSFDAVGRGLFCGRQLAHVSSGVAGESSCASTHAQATDSTSSARG